MKNNRNIVPILLIVIVFRFISGAILFINMPTIDKITTKMSPRYRKYCELIVDDFKNADVNSLFEITDAWFYGDYTYDISMNTKTISSKQDCFEEIVLFFIRLNAAVQDGNSDLYSNGYSLHITGKISGVDFYVTLDGMYTSNITHEILEKPGFYIHTNLFADYSLLNSLVDRADVALALPSKSFSDEEKSMINKQQEENLFNLIWYG